VPLASLEPVKATGTNAKQLVRGKLPNGVPLNIRGYPFDEGIGSRYNTSLTYKLDPSWQRFVAVVGLADGWQDVGPYEILLDDKPHFRTTNPGTFGRNSPGEQLDVAIPPGHKSITFRVKCQSSQAAWANAGFLHD
jgi:hypothetical protein